MMPTKYTKWKILLFSFFQLGAWAQSTAPTNDVKLSPLPYYNFGKGVGLTSPDSLFQFNIRFRMQNRASFVQNTAGENAVDAQIRRLRLRFDGFVGNPQFLYVIQLSFAPGDVGTIEEGSNLNVIRDAAFIYRPNELWNVIFGQTKIPGNRQRINSSGALQLSDRTINNARFNIDRDFGVQVYYQQEQADVFSYALKTAITTGEGRNYTDSPDDGLAYTGKIEVFPLGAFTANGTFFEGDLAYETNPKLLVSAAYHYNHKARKSQGVLGELLAERRNIQSFLADMMFKYKGFAWQAAYMNRQIGHQSAWVPAVDGKSNFVYTGQGFDLQPSYHFPSNYELIARYSYLIPTEEIRAATPKQQQWTLGLTKYYWEHAFKIQSEINFDQYQFLSAAQKTAWYVRFQIEMGI